MRRRAIQALLATALAACAALATGACGGADDRGGAVTVYLSAPLRGADAGAGRDVAEGARMALDEADGEAAGRRVRLEVLDAAARAGRAASDQATVGANARRAARDSSAIAYIGELSSAATRTSLPITNAAGLLQVSPAAGAEDLVREPGTFADVPQQTQPTGERTFARLAPSDAAQATAAAEWARERGVRRATIVADGSAYGRTVAGAFVEEATVAGIEVERERLDSVLRPHPGAARTVAEICAVIVTLPGGWTVPDLVYFAGDDERGLALGCLTPLAGSRIIATDAILADAGDAAPAGRGGIEITSAALDPAHLPPAGQRFAARFANRYDREPGRFAAYGYEAMALTLDSLARAGEDAERQEAIDALLATAERESVLGPYSIAGTGETTLDRLSGYRLANGAVRPLRRLEVP